MVKIMYKILEIVELSFALNEDVVELLVRPVAKEFTEQLMKINPILAKNVLEETGYYEYQVKPILTENIDKTLRREWIDLLKKYYPEKLAELII